MHTSGPYRIGTVGSREGTQNFIDNEGSLVIMGDHDRIAVVDCFVDFKRGQGDSAQCPERDANAERIVALLNAADGMSIEEALQKLGGG